jgi:tetratricopeptide (TPR) repeat protein
MWPYTGKAHPKNGSFPYFDPGGPYPTELGDSFLNRMILDNVDPDEAVARYMDTDVATVKRLDRLQELLLDKQRARDRVCGYEFADWIVSRYQTEPLFRSPSHLETPLTLHLAAQLFERLDMDPAVVEAAAANPPTGLFPISATPIHPSVVEKFGLKFIGKDHRYRYFDEGSFTFEEFAGRYMRFAWNPKLAEGMHWFREGQHDKALEALEQAVVTSPRSAIGRFVLSDLLARQHRLAEAIQRAREAVKLEPENRHYNDRLQHYLNRRAQLSVLPRGEPKRNPRANLVLDFDRTGNAQTFQLEGWSNPEAGYTWTIGPRARLLVRDVSVGNGYKMTFSASPFAPSTRPFQRFTVLVNDFPVGEVKMDAPADVEIEVAPNSPPAQLNTLVITFDLPDAAKPSDFDNASTDQRVLGLAFRRLEIAPAATRGA